jgi:hypothetical protein
MSVRFLISEQDYVRAVALSARPTRLRRAIGLLIDLVLAIVVGRLLAVNLCLSTWWVSAILLASVVVLQVAIRLWAMPWWWRHCYRKYPAIHRSIALELLDEGVRTSTAKGVGTVVWSDIIKWRCNREYVLLYLAPRLFLIVPMRLAHEGLPLDVLITQLQRHVGCAR